jgi:hypothetical protein
MKIGELPGVRPLLAVMLAYQVSNFVYPAIWAYYTQDRVRLGRADGGDVAGGLWRLHRGGAGGPDPRRS